MKPKSSCEFSDLAKKLNSNEISLTAGSKPAMPAYARACGMTVKPTVTPATKSPTASWLEYLNGGKCSIEMFKNLVEFQRFKFHF